MAFQQGMFFYVLGAGVTGDQDQETALDMGDTLNNLLFMGCFLIVANTFKGQVFGTKSAFVDNKAYIMMAISGVKNELRKIIYGQACIAEHYKPKGPYFGVPSLHHIIEEADAIEVSA